MATCRAPAGWALKEDKVVPGSYPQGCERRGTGSSQPPTGAAEKTSCRAAAELTARPGAQGGARRRRWEKGADKQVGRGARGQGRGPPPGRESRFSLASGSHWPAAQAA